MSEHGVAQLRREARAYGAQLHVNPYTALLDEVQWRAGHVAAIREEVGQRGWNQLAFLTEDGDEVTHPLLKRYDAERIALDRVCKLAIDAGIAERYVQLAELQGAVLYRVLTRALDAATHQAGLTSQQVAALKQVFAPALRSALEAESQPA